jgi:hypothetical protein
MIRNRKSGNCRKKCVPGQYRSRSSGRCRKISSGGSGSGSGGSGGSGSGGSGSGGSGSGGSGSGGSGGSGSGGSGSGGSGSGGSGSSSSSSSGNALDHALARLGVNMQDPFSMFASNGVMPPGMHGVVPKPADGRKFHSSGKSKSATFGSKDADGMKLTPLPEPDSSAPMPVPKYITVNGLTQFNPDYRKTSSGSSAVPKYITVNGFPTINPDYGKTSSRSSDDWKLTPLPSPDRSAPMPVPKYITVNGFPTINPDYRKTSSRSSDDWKLTPLPSPDRSAPMPVPKYITVNGLTQINPDYRKTSSETSDHWKLTPLPAPDRSAPKKISSSVMAALDAHDAFRRQNDPSHPQYIGTVKPDYGKTSSRSSAVPKYKTVNGFPTINPDYGKTSSRSSDHWKVTPLPAPDRSAPKKISPGVMAALDAHDAFRRQNDPSHPQYIGNK